MKIASHHITPDIWVIPNSRVTEFSGWRNGRLLLKVHASAREGKANEAAGRYLARFFGVSRTSVRLLSGEKSRLKKFEIIGLSAGLAEKKLAGLLAES